MPILPPPPDDYEGPRYRVVARPPALYRTYWADGPAGATHAEMAAYYRARAIVRQQAAAAAEVAR